MATQKEKVDQLKNQQRRPSGPGALLEDFLESTGMSQQEAARRMKVSRQTVNELINDRRYLTAEMANRLAILCGDNGPEIWIAMQQQRDMWDALHVDKSAFKDVEPYLIAA